MSHHVIPHNLSSDDIKGVPCSECGINSTWDFCLYCIIKYQYICPIYL